MNAQEQAILSRAAMAEAARQAAVARHDFAAVAEAERELELLRLLYERQH